MYFTKTKLLGNVSEMRYSEQNLLHTEFYFCYWKKVWLLLKGDQSYDSSELSETLVKSYQNALPVCFFLMLSMEFFT